MLSTLLVVAVLTLLGWRVLAVNLSDQLADSDSAAALRWDARQHAALLSSAFDALGSDPASAAQFARRAIQASPADGRGYGVLARAEQASGHEGQAQGLYRIGLRLAPRDAPTRAAYAQSLLQKDAWRAAIEQLQVLSWLRPAQQNDVFEDLLRVAENPDGLEAIVDRVLAGPEQWREALIRHLFAHARDARVADRLYAALAASPRPPTDRERRTYLERLTRDGRWLSAWMIWVSGLDAEQTAQLAHLFNGSFELPPSGAPFDWQIDPVNGAQIDLVEDRSVDGSRVLQITFFDQRVDFAHIAQSMVLNPGHYRLSGSVSLEQLQSARGLWWRLRCANRAGSVIAESERFSGNARWRRFEVAFDVPEQDCEGQSLRLESAARGALEKQISGRIWFDDLRVRREEGAIAGGAAAAGTSR